MSKAKKTILSRVCPNCGSEDIVGSYVMSPMEETRFNIRNKMIAAQPINVDYYGCNNCGFYGPSVILPKADLPSFKKKLEQKGIQKMDRPAKGFNSNKKLVKMYSWCYLIALILIIVSFMFMDSVFGGVLLVLAFFFMVLGVIIMLAYFFFPKYFSKST